MGTSTNDTHRPYDSSLAMQHEMNKLRARVAELEAERAELVKEAKKSALTELRKEFQDDYWPCEAKEGISQAIESIDASLQAIDAAREAADD